MQVGGICELRGVGWKNIRARSGAGTCKLEECASWVASRGTFLFAFLQEHANWGDILDDDQRNMLVRSGAGTCKLEEYASWVR